MTWQITFGCWKKTKDFASSADSYDSYDNVPFSRRLFTIGVMGSYAEEDAFCNRMTNGKRNGAKPAFLKVLSDAESKPEPVRTFSDVNKSRYHGYSRWLTRRAKSLTSRKFNVV